MVERRGNPTSVYSAPDDPGGSIIIPIKLVPVLQMKFPLVPVLRIKK